MKKHKELKDLPVEFDLKNVTALDVAMISSNVNAALMLILAGSPYSSDKVLQMIPWLRLLQKPSGYKITVDRDGDEQNYQEHIDHIEAIVSQPRSLRDLSCFAVRRHLGGDIEMKISPLKDQVPAALLSFILLDFLCKKTASGGLG